MNKFKAKNKAYKRHTQSCINRVINRQEIGLDEAILKLDRK